MRVEKAIHALDQGRILARHGSTRLVIYARVGRTPQRSLCIQAAREAFGYIERISLAEEQLKRHLNEIAGHFLDPLAESMLQSVREVGDADLTPLAAVRGALADAVADFLYTRGMTVVLVENGEDAAVRIGEPASLMVGIRPDVGSNIFEHLLELDDQLPSWGIATSGLGHPGLTCGIAASVTVVAETAARADAAATAIANATYVSNAQTIQRPAEEINPGTDIRGRMVTCSIGTLSKNTVSKALDQALRLSRRLIERRVILGALATVQGQTAATDFMEHRLVPAWPFA
ncbi:hypothetical protein [Desulfatiglans anilini]|uniref:hypothetical protein n=1 Tax=Desulfatiglans anilini TaxID=90728 RepID=UPI0003FBB4BE|nr:hypothetical protein [Desulfatiglans anilini]